MRSILVPTDFSHCAEQAFSFAAKLARRLHARLHVVHRLAPAADWVPQAAHERRLTRTDQLNLLAEGQADLEVETALLEGKLSSALAEYTEAHSIDLVVMGSHGASGKSEYFIGSNTQKVVRTLHCPVLVIKREPPSLDFKRVVFASSFNEEDKEAFRRFKEIVLHFLPEIHLVAIHTSSFFDAPYVVSLEAMESFKAMAPPFPCETHIFKDFSVDHGIRAIAEEIGADLIAISNHFRHPLRRMLRGSNVEALVNHANLPVLTIDYPG